MEDLLHHGVGVAELLPLLEDALVRHARVIAAEHDLVLQALISDPAFAWLGPLTALIVRLDEAEEEKDADAERPAFSAAARTLLATTDSPFSRRCAELVQKSPDVAFAYAAARRAVTTP